MKYILMPIVNLIVAILVMFFIMPFIIVVTTLWNGKIDKKFANDYIQTFSIDTIKYIFDPEFILEEN